MSMHSDKEKKKDEGIIVKAIKAMFGKSDAAKIKNRSAKRLKEMGQ